MPVVVNAKESERHELKTAPPDGYVIIKRMNHGEKLERGDLTSKLSLVQEGRGRKSDLSGEIKMMNKQVSLWEFAHLITDHNLQDTDGRLLDFNRPQDVFKLDGRVADEINMLIEKVNNFDEGEDDDLESLGNSSGASELAS